MKKSIRKIVRLSTLPLLYIMTLFCSASVWSGTQESPVLTITYQNKTLSYSLNQLEQMSDSKITTDTPWTRPHTIFEGISLKKIAELVNMPADWQFKVSALNNYWSLIPYADIERYQPILAIKKDGEYMSVREQGPSWVIYPLSSHNELDNDVLHSRMVWQVSKIEIIPE
ncbi:oxidoreductase [Vibrio mangrovi]|uniref:Oxidoreductase n=1 Tax=Vibrio mangrovi TaxID=474394 RepID=A0A1Y6IR97_9VIBR|nr:oxidoreductase [Vibrio mangrovi]MDW6003637.1 oxidoreductase [Vibrio mangrovi]SMR99571.1 hypothetical protein VIM7927_00797 [Vibrio mangrovi]